MTGTRHPHNRPCASRRGLGSIKIALFCSSYFRFRRSSLWRLSEKTESPSEVPATTKRTSHYIKETQFSIDNQSWEKINSSNEFQFNNCSGSYFYN